MALFAVKQNENLALKQALQDGSHTVSHFSYIRNLYRAEKACRRDRP